MKIAQSAIAYVHDGDTLALDTGTTALAFANALIQSSKKKSEDHYFRFDVVAYI